MKQLSIVWQRLVTPEGSTCDRCGSTQTTLATALPKLRQALGPLGIEPVLETRELGLAEFRARPAESNRIWMAGKPLEEWLGATSGQSPCCNACEGSECRTVVVGGESFEAVPEELIIQAGLRAASELLGQAKSPCCAPKQVGCCG